MENDWVFVLAATNRPEDLDSAVLRRFSKKILVDVPNKKDRISLLKFHLKKMKNNLQKNEFSEVA